MILRDKLCFLGAALAGVVVGVGLYTFVYAKGYSYLSSNPAACANCHVMRDHYDGWVKSTHHGAAVCNDCHTPENLAAKYATKASNGFFHSLAFTSGRFPDAIQIKLRNQKVTEAACRRCHGDRVSDVDGPHKNAGGLACFHCHAGVGHSDLPGSAGPLPIASSNRLQEKHP